MGKQGAPPAESGNTGEPVAAAVGTTQVQLLDAENGRFNALVQSSPDNTGNIFVGTSANVVATQNDTDKTGHILLPGQSIDFPEHLGAIHAISDTASQIVIVSETV